jgi:hypothetical protein
VDAGLHQARLADLTTGRALVRLDEAALTDGPWCPDESAAFAYDADLLRIRRLRITLRVQVASAALRGAAGALFLRGGRSTSRLHFVPDQQINIDVTPPNLASGR